MNLKIVRYLSTGAKDSTEFSLDKYFTLVHGDLNLRVQSVDRYEQDGGEETGDEKADPRKFRLARDEAQASDSAYLTKLSSLITYFRAPYNSAGVAITSYYIEDSTLNRRALIRLSNVKDESDRTLIRRVGTTGFDLIWLNSVWEDITESEQSSPSGGTATGETITVTPTGLPTDCIITIVPISTTLTEFTLRNAANGAAITVAAANLATGFSLEIDGTALGGTVKLTSPGGTVTDVSSAVADNTGFIPLIPGSNVITYTSAYGSADITIKWRNRAYF
jgi:hypothetical protein